MAKTPTDLEELAALELAQRLAEATRAYARRISLEFQNLDNRFRVAAAKRLLRELFARVERKLTEDCPEASLEDTFTRIREMRDSLHPLIEEEFSMKVDPEELWVPTTTKPS